MTLFWFIFLSCLPHKKIQLAFLTSFYVFVRAASIDKMIMKQTQKGTPRRTGGCNWKYRYFRRLSITNLNLNTIDFISWNAMFEQHSSWIMAITKLQWNVTTAMIYPITINCGNSCFPNGLIQSQKALIAVDWINCFRLFTDGYLPKKWLYWQRIDPRHFHWRYLAVLMTTDGFQRKKKQLYT